MLTMSEKNHNVFVSVILFLVLNLQTCYGGYTCYQLSSGKDICFMFDEIKQTYKESKLFCQNNGGSLLEIYNNEMQQLVEKFVKSKTTYLGEAWLNLVRSSSNEWVWGNEGPDKILRYSNWDGGVPASYDGSINHAFMNSNYKWMNSYDPHNASTICFQENKRTYIPETSTTSPTTTTTQKPQGTPTEGANKSSSTTSKSTSPSSTTTTVSSLSSQASLPSPSSSSTTTTTSMKANHATPANSESSSSPSTAVGIGIGVGVGLGGLVLIIVSSLLIAKFVFHKKIPLSFKSSRSRKSPPHETGSDVINGDYEHIDEKKLGDRSPYAEVIMSEAPNLPPNSNLNYMGFQDLIQSNSASGVEEPSKADYGTSQTFGKNIYDNAV